VYRDQAEYNRLISNGHKPAPNSYHNHGEAADIHGEMNRWIRENGAQYGWMANDYTGTHGGHFEFKGKGARGKGGGGANLDPDGGSGSKEDLKPDPVSGIMGFMSEITSMLSPLTDFLGDILGGFGDVIGSLFGGPAMATESPLRGPTSYSAGGGKGVPDDPEFKAEVTRLAKKYNIPEKNLYAVMSFESGGSFDPGKKNMAGSGATGLIQFMPATARGLGTSTDALAKMSRVEQMKYVEKYFDQAGLPQGASFEDLYMSILYPKAVGKSNDYVLFGKGGDMPGAYSQNAGLDANNDGSITKYEASASARKHLQQGGVVGKMSHSPSRLSQYTKQLEAMYNQGNTESNMEPIVIMSPPTPPVKVIERSGGMNNSVPDLSLSCSSWAACDYRKDRSLNVV